MRFFPVLLLCAFAQAQDVTPARLDQQAQAFFDQGRFNGSVLVARKGMPLLRKGYGWANAEWRVPAGPDTRFRLGSITKQFTAAAVLQLELQGKLSLKDPISKYYPEAPAAWQNINVEHLLRHSSGIRNYTAQPGYMTGMRRTLKPAEIVQTVTGMPLEFDPGTKFNYSNTGYVLLGMVIEKASGLGYAEYLRKHIFDPLGMAASGYDVTEEVMEHRAAGYQMAAGKMQNAPFLDMSQPYSAGSLYSSVDDLLKWDQALNGDKVLPAPARERMFTPGHGDYGYGWTIKKLGDKQVQEHGGGINGFSTDIVRIPGDGVLVVTLCNVTPCQAGRLAQELTRLALGMPVDLPVLRKEVTLAPALLDKYPGEYALNPAFIMTITREGDSLFAQATGQGKLPLFAEAEDRFFVKAVDAQITFQKDATGKVTGLTLHQNGRDMPAPKK